MRRITEAFLQWRYGDEAVSSLARSRHHNVEEEYETRFVFGSMSYADRIPNVGKRPLKTADQGFSSGQPASSARSSAPWLFAAVNLTAAGGPVKVSGVTVQTDPHLQWPHKARFRAVCQLPGNRHYQLSAFTIPAGQSVTLTLRAQLGGATPQNTEFDIGFKSIKANQPVTGGFPMLRHWIACSQNCF